MTRAFSDVPQNTMPDALPESFDKLRVDLAEQIKRARVSARLSQEDLALASQIDRTYLSLIERHQANPSLLVLARIADTLRSPLTVVLQPAAASKRREEAYEAGLSAAFDIVEQVLEKDAETSHLLERIRLRLITELHMPSDEIALPTLVGATATS
jgi:transcriptional regulator with XRE-family HTH domain